jgi:hypothetical protein
MLWRRRRETMLSDILLFTRTTGDIDVLLGELDRLEESLYKTEGELEETLKTRVRIEVAEILARDLPHTIEGKREMLRLMKSKILALPVVNITVAIDSTVVLVEWLSNLLREMVNNEIIIDIESNRLILGGAIISYQGKFGDFSLQSKIEKAWTEHSEEFVKIAYGNS